MRIAYIELDTHAEIAQRFYSLLKDSNRVEADFYFSSKILSSLSLEKGGNIYLSSPDTLLSDLRKHSYDLVLIGTAHRYFNVFLKVKEEFPTYIIVHNLNFTQKSPLQLLSNIPLKDFSYRLKLLLKEGLLLSPKLHLNKSRLIVLDSHLKSYSNAPLKSLNVFFREKFSLPKNSDYVTIVIPGAVSQDRRDYLQVFKELRDYYSEILREKLESPTKLRMVFLGKCEGKELSQLQALEKEIGQKVELIYFTERVLSQLFSEWMQKADVIWAPIQKEGQFFSGKEYYGLTKMSGAVGDAVSYSLPLLLPSFYQTDYPTVKAQEGEILAQLFDLKEKEILDPMNFQKEKVLDSLEKELQILAQLED